MFWEGKKKLKKISKFFWHYSVNIEASFLDFVALSEYVYELFLDMCMIFIQI